MRVNNCRIDNIPLSKMLCRWKKLIKLHPRILWLYALKSQFRRIVKLWVEFPWISIINLFKKKPMEYCKYCNGGIIQYRVNLITVKYQFQSKNFLNFIKNGSEGGRFRTRTKICATLSVRSWTTPRNSA